MTSIQQFYTPHVVGGRIVEKFEKNLTVIISAAAQKLTARFYVICLLVLHIAFNAFVFHEQGSILMNEEITMDQSDALTDFLYEIPGKEVNRRKKLIHVILIMWDLQTVNC
jgi:hypothetical protein